ncbi:MAG TPA: hypothetical protein VD948_09505 [Rhodothermales bacterium]|nr:hypothetical protein [Rhodothermales bacterium]
MATPTETQHDGTDAAQTGLQRAEMDRAVARRQEAVEQQQKREEKQQPPQKKLTPDELRKQLFEREERINRRLEALQNEAAGAADDAREAIFRNPVVSVSGALAAGLALGLLVGKPKRATWYDPALAYAPKKYRKRLEAWARAAEAEARRAVRKGENAVEAVRIFAAGHEPPLAPMSEAPKKQKEGIIQGILLSAFTTALSTAAKGFVDDIMKGRAKE